MPREELSSFTVNGKTVKITKSSSANVTSNDYQVQEYIQRTQTFLFSSEQNALPSGDRVKKSNVKEVVIKELFRDKEYNCSIEAANLPQLPRIEYAEVEFKMTPPHFSKGRSVAKSPGDQRYIHPGSTRHAGASGSSAAETIVGSGGHGW